MLVTLELDGACGIFILDELDLAGLTFLGLLVCLLSLHGLVYGGLGGGASGCYD